jgi:hypothetical protein
MRLNSALAVVGSALALGMASQSPAEAGWCRGAPSGFCGPQGVTHFVYYPQYYDIYYTASLLPDPYPAIYMPRGYWPRYQRPYAAYGRRYWAPRRWAGPVVAVPAPNPVPVGCCLK